jgi:hypothetical protein
MAAQVEADPTQCKSKASLIALAEREPERAALARICR